MEWGTWAQWLSAGVATTALGITLYAANSRARKSQVDGLEHRVRATEKDIVEIKSDIEHMPTKDSLHEISQALLRVEGRLGRVEEGLIPLRSISDRIQDFLMQPQGRK